MAGKITVVFRAGSETRELVSPRLDDDRVQADMAALRQAQNDGRQVDLDWITILGGNIVAASVTRLSVSRPRIV